MYLSPTTKIIVVDDDRVVVDQISRILTNLGSRNIITFTTEKPAIIALSKELFDLAIIDLRMPQNGGVRLINYIKTHFDKKIQKTPLMVLYGTVSDPELALVSEFAFTKMLKKPFTDEIFVEELIKSISTDEMGMENDLPDQVDYEEACRRGMEAIYMGHTSLARAYIEPKLKIEPASVRLNTMMGQILFNEKNLGLSAQTADKILLKNRKYLPAINLKIKVLVAMGAYNKALELMEEAQVLSPLNIRRLLGMGEIHLANGRLSLALEKFSRALDICPTSEQAIIGMAKVKIELGELDEGIFYLDKLQDIGSVVSEINLKAVMLAKAGKTAESLILYDRAIQCCQFNRLTSQIHYNKALAYIRASRIGAAKDSLEDSIKIDGNNTKAQDLLARLNMGVVPDLKNNNEFEFCLSDRQKKLLIGTLHAGADKK